MTPEEIVEGVRALGCDVEPNRFGGVYLHGSDVALASSEVVPLRVALRVHESAIHDLLISEAADQAIRHARCFDQWSHPPHDD